MREIKFRVCDSRYIEDGWSEYDIYELLNLSVVSFNNNDYKIVRQYAGLKDKNGVEIYEGDVVKVIDGYTNGKDYYDLIEPVTFEKGCFLIGNDYFRSCEESYEVIGNIYEHRGLLDDTDS